jgi:hypothetical protein
MDKTNMDITNMITILNMVMSKEVIDQGLELAASALD